MLDFINGNYAESFNKVLTENPELKVAFKFFRKTDASIDMLNLMREYNLPYFYADYVKDFDTLNWFYKEGVKSVYIVEEFGYYLDVINRVVNGLEIRVYPNIAQSSAQGDDFRKFYIRPDDVYLYEDYVDIFEFLPAYNNSNDEFAITYREIYTGGRWYGNLKEIIVGLNVDVNNRNIIDNFGISRLYCHKKCTKGLHCDMCNKVKEFAELVLDKGFLIADDKDTF